MDNGKVHETHANTQTRMTQQSMYARPYVRHTGPTIRAYTWERAEEIQHKFIDVFCHSF